jgi:serine protease
MMKTRVFIAIGCLLALASLVRTRASGPVRGILMQGAGAAEVRQGEVIVKFHDATDDATRERAIRAAGGLAARRSAFGPRYRVQLKDGIDIPEALGRLATMGEVEYATPNHVRRALFIPNDPLFSVQWNLQLVHAPRTWDIQKGDPSVVVAIIDTGVAFENFGQFAEAPDWGPTVFVPGLNIFSNDSHANDDNGHGTNVASIVAEEANNDVGYAGLAFNCSIMPLKVLQADGTGEDFGISEAIDYARTFTLNGRNPVKVINMSLGGTGDDPTLDAAIDRAYQAGITIVAAAGNHVKPGDPTTVSFPAAHPNVIAVGAVDSSSQITFYSNVGPEVAVVAPGGSGTGNCTELATCTAFVFTQNFDVFTPQFNVFTYFIGYSGTSQATPHVSAIAALLYQQGITSPAAILAAIEHSAQHLGTGAQGTRNDQYGYGLVRPDQALSGLGLNQ